MGSTTAGVAATAATIVAAPAAGVSTTPPASAGVPAAASAGVTTASACVSAAATPGADATVSTTASVVSAAASRVTTAIAIAAISTAVRAGPAIFARRRRLPSTAVPARVVAIRAPRAAAIASAVAVIRRGTPGHNGLTKVQSWAPRAAIRKPLPPLPRSLAGTATGRLPSPSRTIARLATVLVLARGLRERTISTLVSITTLTLAVAARGPRWVLLPALVAFAVGRSLISAVREPMPSRARLLLAASPVHVALAGVEVAVTALHARRIVLRRAAAEALPALLASVCLTLTRPHVLTLSTSVTAEGLRRRAGRLGSRLRVIHRTAGLLTSYAQTVHFRGDARGGIPHDVLHLADLAVERRGRRRRTSSPAEEALVGCNPVVSGTRRRSQAGAVGNHWHASGHHAAAAEGSSVNPAGVPHRRSAKVPRGHVRYRVQQARIVFNSAQVGVAMGSAIQRTKATSASVTATAAIVVVDIGHIHDIDTAPVPGVVVVPGADRQPADVAKSEAHTEAKAATKAESEEGDVSRRPHRVIAGIDGPQPPAPGAAIKEPAAIVIGGPAPGLIGYPGPAVIGLPDPAAVTVRRPTRADGWRPHPTVVGHIDPVPVIIQILRSGVVTVGVAPAFGTAYPTVPVAVPAVPIVPFRRRDSLIFRVGRALDRNQLPTLDTSAALRRGDLRLPLADDHLTFRGRIHLDAIHARLQRTNGHIRRVNFDVGIAVAQLAEVDQTQAHLHLHAITGKVGDFGVGVIRQAQDIGVIELHLSPRSRPGGHLVAGYQRRVQLGIHPVTGVATLHGDVSVDQADAPHAGLYLRPGVNRRRHYHQNHCQTCQMPFHGPPPTESARGLHTRPL